MGTGGGGGHNMQPTQQVVIRVCGHTAGDKSIGGIAMSERSQHPLLEQIPINIASFV